VSQRGIIQIFKPLFRGWCLFPVQPTVECRVGMGDQLHTEMEDPQMFADLSIN